MRLGVIGAVPVEVVAASTPVAGLILTDDHHKLLVAILELASLIGAAHGQLPADLGLGLDERHSFGRGQVVECAAVSAGEVLGVVEDAGALDDSSLLVAVLHLRPALFLPGGVVLPRLWREFGHPARNALLVLLAGEVGAMNAAPGIGSLGADALASPAEDACPSRGEPGEVSFDHLLGIGRVDELDPLAGKVDGDRLRGHGRSLGGASDRAESDTGARNRHRGR